VFGKSFRQLLVFGALGRVENSAGASLECCLELEILISICPYLIWIYLSHNWYNLGWLVAESMREVFVEGDEVGDVDVAEVLPRQHILSYLISVACYYYSLSCALLSLPVDEDIVEMEFEDEVDQLLLNALVALFDRLILAK
jgi:hypothetical protein